MSGPLVAWIGSMNVAVAFKRGRMPGFAWRGLVVAASFFIASNGFVIFWRTINDRRVSAFFLGNGEEAAKRAR